MKALFAALWVESLKVRKSKIFWITFLFFAFIAIMMGLLVFIDPKWNFNPADNHLAWYLLRPIALTVLAVVILNAVAILMATAEVRNPFPLFSLSEKPYECRD